MIDYRMLPYFSTLVLLCNAWAGTSPADSTDAILTRMDNAAAQFQGMTAKADYVTHVAVINDDSKESGTVKLRKVKPNEIQGLLDFTSPDRRILLFRDRKLQIYTPASNTVRTIDLSRYKDKIDQYLMLGFGTRRADIERAYQVTVKEPQQVNGTATTLLELIPKSPEALKVAKRVQLWVSDATGTPVQEKLYQPSGDTNTWVFHDVVINPTPKLQDSDLKLKLPPGVQRESQ